MNGCVWLQVCAVRLPVEVLEQHMAQILEGLLLWSEDSKNKFRLKVHPARLLVPCTISSISFERAVHFRALPPCPDAVQEYSKHLSGCAFLLQGVHTASSMILLSCCNAFRALGWD